MNNKVDIVTVSFTKPIFKIDLTPIREARNRFHSNIQIPSTVYGSTDALEFRIILLNDSSPKNICVFGKLISAGLSQGGSTVFGLRYCSGASLSGSPIVNITESDATKMKGIYPQQIIITYEDVVKNEVHTQKFGFNDTNDGIKYTKVTKGSAYYEGKSNKTKSGHENSSVTYVSNTNVTIEGEVNHSPVMIGNVGSTQNIDRDS